MVIKKRTCVYICTWYVPIVCTRLATQTTFVSKNLANQCSEHEAVTLPNHFVQHLSGLFFFTAARTTQQYSIPLKVKPAARSGIPHGRRLTVYCCGLTTSPLCSGEGSNGYPQRKFQRVGIFNLPSPKPKNKEENTLLSMYVDRCIYARMHCFCTAAAAVYGRRHLLHLVASEKNPNKCPENPSLRPLVLTAVVAFQQPFISVVFSVVSGQQRTKVEVLCLFLSRASRTDKRWTQDRYWAGIHVAPTTVEAAKHEAPTSCRQSIDSCTPSKQDAVEWLIADPKSGVNDLDGAIQASTTAASYVAACFYGFRYEQYHSQQDLQSVRCCRTYSRAIS